MHQAQTHHTHAATRSESLENLIQLALTANEDELRNAIAGLKGNQPKATLQGPLLIAIGKAAEFLGVSRVTLWRMTKAGRIPKVEILPGSYRIRRADLEAYVYRKENLFVGKDSAGSNGGQQWQDENIMHV